jgi:hypothetical protein
METSTIILIGVASAFLVFLAIFMVISWYTEKKKKKALAQKDLIERSFMSPNASVRSILIYSS